MAVPRWGIVFAAAALVAFLIALASVRRAHGAVLTCTAPTGGQLWTKVYDPEIGDSTWSADCSGGPAIHDSLWVVLWRQPVTGGGFWPSDSVRVAPGDSVRFTVGPGHYYAIARNGIGPSCATEAPVYVPPGDPTGVPVDPATEADPVILVHLYAVTGQQVGLFSGHVWDRLWKAHGVMERSLLLRGITQGRLAAGVYFVRGVTSGGALTRSRRVVLLR